MNTPFTKYAGERAKGGFYFNTKTWEIHLHRKSGTMLPGEDDRYVKIPTVALLVLGPLMGFLFVIFLPAIGFALFFRELGRKGWAWAHRPARKHAEAKSTGR